MNSNSNSVLSKIQSEFKLHDIIEETITTDNAVLG